MFSHSFITLVLALACAAHPLVHVARNDNRITLPLAKRFNVTGAATIADRDKARFKQLSAASQPAQNRFQADDATAYSAQLANILISYTAKVSIGSDATTYNLVVDTGSSNTWVGASPSNRYKPSHPPQLSPEKPQMMVVSYGSGDMKAFVVHDQIAIGGLTIQNQTIGAAWESTGFDGVDGILGIGPTDLTKGTLEPDSEMTVPTVTDTAFAEGLISKKVVGISFEPVSTDGQLNGELTFGSADPSKYTGDLNTMKITTVSPASMYVGIEQSITYGDAKTAILDSTAGIVDTGTTLLLLATDAYNNYVTVTGATMDTNVGLLSLPVDEYDNLQSLYFNINGVSYEFTNNAQIWPRSLNSQLNGTSDKIYLIISDVGSTADDEIDFINGQVFLERFYTTYDSQNGEFGIAQTDSTFSTQN